MPQYTFDDAVEAIKKHDITMLKHIINYQPWMLNERESKKEQFSGHTLLHYAAMHGFYEGCDLLIRLGLDIHDENNYPSTPFQQAMNGGNIKVIKLFIANGADVNRRTTKNQTTPLMYAAAFDKTGDMIRLLLDNGADIDAVENDGTSALHFAAKHNYRRNDEGIKVLVAYGARIDIKDKDGNTPVDRDWSTTVQECINKRDELWAVECNRKNREVLQDRVWKLACLSKAFSDTVIEFVDVDA